MIAVTAADPDTADGARAPYDAWRAGAIGADVLMAAHASGKALDELRRARLASLLQSALTRSSIYRDWLGTRDPQRVALADLPIAQKAALMARFDEWIADPQITLRAVRRHTADPSRVGEPFLGRYTVWESSGSSGEPGLFVQDEHAMAVYDALEALRRPMLRPLDRLFDPWGWTERLVFVGASDGHYASTVTIERLRRMNPTAAGRTTSVSFLQPMAQLVAQLDALAPTILATYPSLAVLLASEHAAGRLHAAPREIWTGGEMLSAEAAAHVGQVFGCPVIDSYGASECLALASSCPFGALHLNTDWVILESVDARGRAVPPGSAGATTLLTNLANHVQPIIRYDLGDRVTFKPTRCACGSNLPVVQVQGRSDDTLRFAGTGQCSVDIVPLAISTVLEEEGGLFDFQLRQTSTRELVLSSPSGAALLRRSRSALARFLAAQGASGVRIRCSAEDGRRAASGKLKRIVACDAR